MKKLFVFSFILALFLGACGKDDDATDPVTVDDLPKPIVIQINSPADGAALDLEIPTSVQVRITRENNGIINYVRIDILDITDAVLKTLVDEEVDRMGTYNYSNINAFMANSSGAYKIRVRASEPNGANEVVQIHKFTLE